MREYKRSRQARRQRPSLDLALDSFNALLSRGDCGYGFIRRGVTARPVRSAIASSSSSRLSSVRWSGDAGQLRPLSLDSATLHGVLSFDSVDDVVALLARIANTDVENRVVPKERSEHPSYLALDELISLELTVRPSDLPLDLTEQGGRRVSPAKGNARTPTAKTRVS